MNLPLREHALRIWQAGLDAVHSETLIRNEVRVETGKLLLMDEELSLDEIDRIVVVGGGKAGGGMAIALEEALGSKLAAEKRLSGWVNVPDDCLRPTRWIHLHPARPAGRNEPTAEGVQGTEEILRRVGGLGPRDLCLVLISGGGSALLPAPVPEIALQDKLLVTKHLSAAGADIHELNAVRKQLSRIKGGGLARACRADRLIGLIISDVLGDPLDVIASGPTVEDSSAPPEALAVLEKYHAREAGVSSAVFDYLERKLTAKPNPPACAIANLILGNNAVAVDGAGVEAEKLGYSHVMFSAREEGTAEEVGQGLAEMAPRMLEQDGPNCLIIGGEPVVKLVPQSERGKGGRNQQLVLAALCSLWKQSPAGRFVILSGGTDGEDGPTDAAGAYCDEEVLGVAERLGLDPFSYLRRNDAYSFFAATGGLLKTGPTHTNVCDLRVVIVER